MPLIGTKCCINYNPVLTQRQFRYPIRGSPTPAALIPLLAYYEDGPATNTLKQVRASWGHVIRMEKDSRSWTLDREEQTRDTKPEEVKLLKKEI